MVASGNSTPAPEQLQRQAAFFEGLLGLHRFLEEERLPGLEAGPFRLTLDRSAPTEPVLEVCVPDLLSAKAAVMAAGCRLEREEPGVPRYSLCDPFGLRFRLSQSSA